MEKLVLRGQLCNSGKFGCPLPRFITRIEGFADINFQSDVSVVADIEMSGKLPFLEELAYGAM